MWDAVSQIAIFVLGVTSIVLVARKNKWGFVAALAVQPFWILTSYINKQWGIFFVSFVYGGSWLYGAYKWFADDRKAKRNAERATS